MSQSYSNVSYWERGKQDNNGRGEKIEMRHGKMGGIVNRREAYEAPKIGLGPFPDGAPGRSGGRVCRSTSHGAAKIRQIIPPKGGSQLRNGLLSGGHRRTG
jgi:hypothetical protein